MLYLDDQHTRGSDFQLPLGRHAVVTLGKGMQKDKLFQATMRMRQLGKGHTVSFAASFEADLQIGTWRGHMVSLGSMPDASCSGIDSCKTRYLVHLPAILSWCLSNTVSQTCDKLLYLAAQGISQLRKRHASICHAGQLHLMAEACAESEPLTLQELYGHSCHTAPLPQLVGRLFSSTLAQLNATQNDPVLKMAAMIEGHIKQIASDVYRSSGLSDEEHERELEEELEEEREVDVERPGIVSPCTPKVSRGLLDFARSGQAKQQFLSLNKAFRQTSFAAIADCRWDSLVEVTPDFVNTVEGDCVKDSFLRSVTWVLVAKVGPAVLVSNFEAEELAAYFFNREGKTALNLVVPTLRPKQNIALPSVPNHLVPSIAIEVFAGSLHGDEAFLRDARHFLGLCERQPTSPVWMQLFERSAIECDGFVLPAFREEVSQALSIRVDSAFTSSPMELLRCLYTSRHLSDLLQTSPLGQLVCAVDVSRLTTGPMRRIASEKSLKAKAASIPSRSNRASAGK